MTDEPTGVVVPGTYAGATNDIGPRKMSNPAFVALEVWKTLNQTPPSVYRLRQLLSNTSPMWADDCTEAREVLAHRSMLTRVQHPQGRSGLDWRTVEEQEMQEVCARFTEADLTGGAGIGRAKGEVPVQVVLLALIRQGREWRAHEIRYTQDMPE